MGISAGTNENECACKFHILPWIRQARARAATEKSMKHHGVVGVGELLESSQGQLRTQGGRTGDSIGESERLN
jgi:hypothetical protein